MISKLAETPVRETNDFWSLLAGSGSRYLAPHPMPSSPPPSPPISPPPPKPPKPPPRPRRPLAPPPMVPPPPPTAHPIYSEAELLRAFRVKESIIRVSSHIVFSGMDCPNISLVEGLLHVKTWKSVDAQELTLIMRMIHSHWG